jgi:glycosyltransferase involved in cell wall biosynthesis
MALKVMIYSHAWAPTVGGVQTVTITLAQGLTEWPGSHPGEDVEVTLVTQTAADGMDDRDVPFRVVRQPRKTELISLIRSTDVIHIANPAFLPLALGWLFNKPTVVEHDGYQSVCPNGLLIFEPDRSVCPGNFLARRYRKCIQCNSGGMGWLRSFLSLVLTFPRRWLAARAMVNIAPTQHIAGRIMLPRTRVIHHGVPCYSSLGDGRISANDNNAPYFAYVGRLVREKGIPVLLRACAKLSESGCLFRLKIIGDGTERERLEAMAKELGLRPSIDFLGSVPVGSIPGLLNGAMAVVMPSIWEDVAPLVAYEQLMQGRLVIASDIGGLGEIVDGLGLKFPPGDANALMMCMRRALEEPDLVKELQDKARRRAAEAFTQERMVTDHLCVFRELAGIDAEW